MKKFLTKTVAALASAVTLSSMAGAIPTSAIDMSYGVGKNSAMRYTVYTTKLSDTQIKLTVNITTNPGIGAITLLVKSDPAFKGKNDSERCDLPNRLVSGTYVYNEETNLACIPCVVDANSHKEMEFSIIYDVDKNDTAMHDFKVGFISYFSPNEPEAKFGYTPDDDFSDCDANISVSPSVNVRLGDIDNDNYVDTIDLFYMEKMVADSNGHLSTTYLDQQLKNRNSTWSKNYPFLKCAAVADIDHNAVIEKADSDSLGKYIAEKGAGVSLTNKEINTLFPVTVVYEN